MSHHREEASARSPEDRQVSGEGGDCVAGADVEETQPGERRTRKVLSPIEPTEQEIAEHNLTHLPFRNWCRHCARGRGTELPHRKSPGERVLPEVHFDFCFMGEEDKPGDTLPILVVREVASRMTLATVVPLKSTGAFVAKRVVAFLREIGCEQCDLVAKSDQEPAIVAIVTEVGRMRAANGAGRYIVESSPVGSSASNGVVERAIRSVEQQVRVMRDAFEGRTRVKLSARHPLMTWIVEYSGYLLSRFEVGNDGKTAYERCKGK